MRTYDFLRAFPNAIRLESGGYLDGEGAVWADDGSLNVVLRFSTIEEAEAYMQNPRPPDEDFRLAEEAMEKSPSRQ